MKKIGNTVYIESTDDAICALCGKKEEVRPYGQGGKMICWDCGDATPEARAIRDAAIDEILDGPGEKAH